jgi:pimeloyl-ACP methyl ester carboxylesterase
MNRNFIIQPEELDLTFSHGIGHRQLAFQNWKGTPEAWKNACRDQLSSLLGLENSVNPGIVREVRRLEEAGVTIQALIMQIDDTLSIPAYLLVPAVRQDSSRVVMAIHGHGEAEACIGVWDDYHHSFARAIAQAGYLVLCPELRGFGALFNLAFHRAGSRLDYWRWGEPMAYSLVTDGFLYGKTLIGETTADLLRWETWLAENQGITSIDVVGISYGGDLALLYPVFSQRVERIFASGSLGSFGVVFEQCYNAPAHCIPGILQWMDRSDIAGLNAPKSILLHFGELDVPGPTNFSASYNASVPIALDELRAIYQRFGFENRVQMQVSPEKGHEMDIPLILKYLDQTILHQS